MIGTKEYGEAAVEVLDIIKHMDEDQIDLIPLDFIQKLKEKQLEGYNANIDYTKPLEENTLKHTTKVMLALIYRDYLCTTDEEKIEFNNTLKNQSYKKFNTNMFEKRVEDTDSQLKLVPVEKKKSIFEKIFYKFFKK